MHSGSAAQLDRFGLGASDAINTLFTCVTGDCYDGILLPKPQYPLYAATVSKLGGSAVYYELEESKGWSINMSDLLNSYADAKRKKIDVKILVVISPGNPAPTILRENGIIAILSFCKTNNIICLADEVYQDNIYDPSTPFISFRKVLLQNPDLEGVQLASVHSASKGYYGECGLRAGLMQLENVSDSALDLIYKMRSVELCANTVGQCVMTAVTNPPVPGDQSYETFVSERY